MLPEEKKLNFSEKIIQRIKEEKLIPKPKWSFFLKNYVVWTFGALSVLLGAISFSLIIYLFKAGGDDLSTSNFNGNFWELFLAIVPIFWLLFLGLFTFLAYLNIKKTKRAYKYSPVMIFFSSIIVSIALGATFFMFGAGQKFDDILGRNTHPFFYKNFMNPQVGFWSDPENGRLSGVVSELNQDQSFFIIDVNEQKWKVYFSKDLLEGFIDIKVGCVLKFVGEKISDEEFRANEIMPMAPGREFFNNRGRGPLNPVMIQNHSGDPNLRIIISPR